MTIVPVLGSPTRYALGNGTLARDDTLPPGRTYAPCTRCGLHHSTLTCEQATKGRRIIEERRATNPNAARHTWVPL